MGEDLRRSYGPDGRFLQDQRPPDGRRHQEHRRGGRLFQCPIAGTTRHSRAVADHYARLGSRNLVQGVHHESRRGRRKARALVHRFHRTVERDYPHSPGDQGAFPRSVPGCGPGGDQESLRFRRGRQVPFADVPGRRGAGDQYSVCRPGYEDRHRRHRRDGPGHEYGHRQSVQAPVAADQ